MTSGQHFRSEHYREAYAGISRCLESVSSYRIPEARGSASGI